jgi:probable HAF family extracellular repeat protein
VIKCYENAPRDCFRSIFNPEPFLHIMKIHTYALAALYLSHLSICGAASMVVLDVDGGPTSLSADGSYLIGGGSSGFFRWNNGTLLFVSDSSFVQFRDLSADGTILVGTENPNAFRWEDGVRTNLQLPLVNSPRTAATAISADGTVIVGYVSPPPSGAGGPEAAMWKDGPISGLGKLNENGESYAVDVSGDGSIIVGRSHPPETTDDWVTFRWENGVMTNLGHPQEGNARTTPSAISADGRFIVGSTEFSSVDERAFVWEDGAFTILDHPDPTSVGSRILDVSGDGSVMVGYTTTPGDWFYPAIWLYDNGYTAKLFVTYLSELGIDLGEYEIFEITDVSADGSTIAGVGWFPAEGSNRPFIVRLVDAEEWGGFEVLPDGHSVNMEGFIGYIDITVAPWVWVYSLGSYVYMDESYVNESGAWLWMPQ